MRRQRLICESNSEEYAVTQQNTDRIRTTHIGSLPRPHDLLDLMKARYAGQPYDHKAYDALLTKSVADAVRRQVDCGIDIVTDGEFSKVGFFAYIRERLEGFEPRPDQKLVLFQQEVAAFPEYYAQYFKEAMMGGAIVPIVPVVCTAPVRYRGEKLLQIDIDNVKAAAKAAGVPDNHVFLPADGGVGRRHQRALPERRRLFPRARGRACQGVPGDRRGGPPGPGRRSVPARHLRRAGSRRCAEKAARRDLRRGNQCGADGHSARDGALPHLLRHQRRAAHP